MRLGRLVLILLVIALAYWLATRAGWIRSGSPEGVSATSPVDRARTAAAASSGRSAQTGEAQREADTAAPGAITENMTPDQVRALLGPPEETSTETTETGATRERWSYRRVGKTVVFENGVVVRIE